MEKEIKILISLSNSIVISVNQLYAARAVCMGGRYHAQVYKTTKARDYCREVREQLRAVKLTGEQLEMLKSYSGFDLYLDFVFKKGINSRDTSNACKCLEDIFVKYVKEDLGVEDYDDAKHIRVVLSKSIFPKASQEYIVLRLVPTTHNIRFDTTDKPNGVSLFNLEETDLKVDKRKKIKFNTAGDDMSIFYITASIFNPQLTAKIIDSAYTMKSVYIAVEDSDWSEDAKQELTNVLDLVKNKDNVHIKTFTKKEEIKDWINV